jgi:16S rRNA processing protein RimM
VAGRPAVAAASRDAAAIVVMGRVGGAYGVRGMVRIVPLSEDPLALLDQAQWWIQPRDGGEWQQRGATGARAHGNALVASLQGVATREDAERLRGAMVGVPRAALPALQSDEMYWADLEGLGVVNREGIELGRVAGLMDNGAHAILRVRPKDGPERLIPWVAAHVDGIDVAAGRIDVDWPSEE